MEPITELRLSRRTVLAAAAATGLLTACGGAGSGTDAPAATAEAKPGEVLAAVDDVPVGGGVINQQGRYVVTQPRAGEFRAFSSVCPHQQCQVSAVDEQGIFCGCHGSLFNRETGEVEGGPAPRGLAEIPVRVESGNVVRA